MFLIGYVWDTTEGFFSRWVVVPFPAFFPAGVADPLLIDRLTSQRELQGLLRMAVGGLQQVMRRGAFTLPRSVADATARFRKEADPLQAFIEERIDKNTGYAFIARTDVYVTYVAWSGQNGYQAMSSNRFYEAFGTAAASALNHPIKTTAVGGVRGYRSIGIK